jgi:hypothetical protein
MTPPDPQPVSPGKYILLIETGESITAGDDVFLTDTGEERWSVESVHPGGMKGPWAKVRNRQGAEREASGQSMRKAPPDDSYRATVRPVESFTFTREETPVPEPSPCPDCGSLYQCDHFPPLARPYSPFSPARPGEPPACPKCGNTLQHDTPSDRPHLRRCASCKYVFAPAPVAPPAPAADPAGTMNCPVCAQGSPHSHAPKEIAAWLRAQASRFGYVASVALRPAGPQPPDDDVMSIVGQTLDSLRHEVQAWSASHGQSPDCLEEAAEMIEQLVARVREAEAVRPRLKAADPAADRQHLGHTDGFCPTCPRCAAGVFVVCAYHLCRERAELGRLFCTRHKQADPAGGADAELRAKLDKLFAARRARDAVPAIKGGYINHVEMEPACAAVLEAEDELDDGRDWPTTVAALLAERDKLAARVREAEAENRRLAHHIDRRADGMDPLTKALRAERDAAFAAGWAACRAEFVAAVRTHLTCNCGPAYLDRGLTAHDCPWHAYARELLTEDEFAASLAPPGADAGPTVARFGEAWDVVVPAAEGGTCRRCDGDGKAHGSDRPFEWSGPGTYPGPCPKCNGTGRAPAPPDSRGGPMTPDDVTKAAERCQDFAGPGWLDLENASPECLADLLTLARAYLALAPVPPDVVKAAKRIAESPYSWGYHDHRVVSGDDGFHSDDAPEALARWALDVRRAAGGGA